MVSCSMISAEAQYGIWSGPGIPRKVAMSISGHKTEGVCRRYDIVSASDMRRAADKMGWVEGFEPSATGTTIRRSTN